MQQHCTTDSVARNATSGSPVGLWFVVAIISSRDNAAAVVSPSSASQIRLVHSPAVQAWLLFKVLCTQLLVSVCTDIMSCLDFC
jgi:hypothetical protein